MTQNATTSQETHINFIPRITVIGVGGGGSNAVDNMIALDLQGVRLTAVADADLVDAVVFAGAAADVRDVVVGGRFVVRDREHVALDVPRELNDALTGVA